MASAGSQGVVDDSNFIDNDVIELIQLIVGETSSLRGSVLGKRASPLQQAVLRTVFGKRRTYGALWDTASVDNGRPYVCIPSSGDHRSRIVVRRVVGGEVVAADLADSERRFLPIRETWERDIDDLLLSTLESTTASGSYRLSLTDGVTVVRVQPLSPRGGPSPSLRRPAFVSAHRVPSLLLSYLS